MVRYTSFLAWDVRNDVVKINIMPRLLYPLKTIAILLTNKIVKELYVWLSSFIWKKQKPRLKCSKLKLFSKNLFGSLGGFDWYKSKKKNRNWPVSSDS